MTEHQDGRAPAEPIGGASLMPDAARWRARSAAASVDLPTMRRAAVASRADFEDLDLGTTMRGLSAMAEGGHAMARMVQADLHAVRLVRAAGAPVPDALLSLCPTEPGAVTAVAAADGSWTLAGTQRSTVHLGAAEYALVAASTPDGERVFRFATDAPGLGRETTPLSAIAPIDPNGPVTFAAVPAVPVGTAAWWSARLPRWDDLLIDVACWFGACVWLCREIEADLAVRTHRTELQRIGRLDVWVHSARLALRDAVPVVEPDPTSRAAEIAARRAAATVTTTTETVIRLAAALSDARRNENGGFLPSRVAQLQISLRRADPQGNLLALGQLLADASAGRPEATG